MLGALKIAAIASVLSALAAGYAAWSYQEHRYETEKAELYASAQSALRVQEQRYAEQFQRATAASAARQQGLRRDAERARLTADGLRHDLQRAVRAAEDSPGSCPDTAAALGELLGAMEAEGRGLAEVCDRHASDVRTLMDAWPR